MKDVLKYLFILLASIISTNVQILHAEIYPVGSYQKTCVNINVKNDVLSANCKTLIGKSQATALKKLNVCLNSINQYGDIGNIDGNLICLPDLPKVDPQLVFPQSETKINKWIYAKDLPSIYKHAWGIWAGLTSFAGNINGTPVRAFEAWNTPSNMIHQIESMPKKGLTSSHAPAKRLRLDLSVPNQFKNKKGIKGNLSKALKYQTSKFGDTNIFVSVAYNPPAAIHAISNKLFLQSTLNRYLKEGYTEIPNFPNNAITIKPVYKVIPKNVKNGIYKFPGWPGTPKPAKTFSEKSWGACVYVDINNTGKGGNSIDHGCKGRNKNNTFFLSNFIHNKITRKEDAKFLSTQLGITVSVGDYAILVGMHVTTREIKRWAWQTFWWSANPNKPYLPSLEVIAKHRPASLDAAAKHYAMSVAYQMVSPAQAITAGKNIGKSVIAYNPHLEAGFDPAVFQIVSCINGNICNQYGVQTNCMTCHNLALYDLKTNYSINKGANRETPYGTDYYMSIADETFNTVLKLDFAWSILGSLKLDDNK